MGFPNPTTSTVVKLAHITTDSLTGTTTTLPGRFSTDSMPYFINVFCETISQISVSIDFDWYDVPTDGERIDNNTVTINSAVGGEIARGSFPVIAPWVEITIRTTAVIPSGNFTLDLWLSGVPTQGDGVVSAASNLLLAEDGTTLVSGAAQQFQADQVRWGWGFWTCQVVDAATGAAAANWLARLYSLNRTGTQLLLDSVGSGGLWIPRMIFFPSNTILLDVVQNDGANRTLYATARFHPGPL